MRFTKWTLLWARSGECRHTSLVPGLHLAKLFHQVQEFEARARTRPATSPHPSQKEYWATHMCRAWQIMVCSTLLRTTVHHGEISFGLYIHEFECLHSGGPHLQWCWYVCTFTTHFWSLTANHSYLSDSGLDSRVHRQRTVELELRNTFCTLREWFTCTRTRLQAQRRLRSATTASEASSMPPEIGALKLI